MIADGPADGGRFGRAGLSVREDPELEDGAVVTPGVTVYRIGKDSARR